MLIFNERSLVIVNEKNDRKKEKKRMSHLYKNNIFAMALLGAGALLTIIAIVGVAFNPILFSSFSWMTFGVISSIAGYMLYNIKKIYNDTKPDKKDR